MCNMPMQLQRELRASINLKYINQNYIKSMLNILQATEYSIRIVQDFKKLLFPH